jgi:hypothetical protein
MDTVLADNDRWGVLSRKVSEARIASVFKRFAELGVDPVLIKGWAAARWYPSTVHRFYGDTDLAVSESDFETLTELSRKDPMILAGVDLHRELRHLDTVSWDDLFARSELVDLDGTAIRVLSPEDHLRVLAVHWLNDGGAYKERLWDIYYAIAHRPEDFDWEKCLGVVSGKRQKWIISAIGLAHKYLDLYIDDLPFAEEARDLPEWLVNAVECEWRTDVRLRPLETCLRDPAEFLRQLRKRFPPNPIQATIEVEGEFDDGGRAIYQLKDILKRTAPSIRRIAGALRSK